jgi:hypothetical protein
MIGFEGEIGHSGLVYRSLMTGFEGEKEMIYKGHFVLSNKPM